MAWSSSGRSREPSREASDVPLRTRVHRSHLVRSGGRNPEKMSGLTRLLDPQTIAIAGLSVDRSKHGGRVLGHLRRLRFQGTIWGVHPQVPQTDDVEMFRSIAELPHPPDLVVSAVPAAAAIDVVAAANGVGAVVVFAGGFGESGDDGLAREAALGESASTTDARLLGPNSGGVIRATKGLAASFLTCLERPASEIRSGPVGVVTQSGGIGSYLHNLAAGRGGGLAALVSTGNEVDIKLGESIDALSRLDEVKVVLAIVETVRDGEVFIEAVQGSIRRGKPVVVCRLGTGARGHSLMRTHTGAMALPDKVFLGVLESLDVVVAETPEEALDVAETLAHAGRPRGGRAGIVTHSGGMAIHLADLGASLGLDMPTPGHELSHRLQPFLDHGAPTNPLDMGGIISGPTRFAEVVRAFAESGDYDMVLAVSTAHPPDHSQQRVESLLALSTGTPILHLWMAGDQADKPFAALRAGGVPVTENSKVAIRTVASLCRLADYRDRVHPEPIVGDPESWGFRFVDGEVVDDVRDAVTVADRIGFPVVLKAILPGVSHKTDVGGVKTGLSTEQELRAAYVEIVAATAGHSLDGVRVEKSHEGLEVIVGAVVDPSFGPLVSVGLGGILVELLDDVVFAPAPVSDSDARGMIERLRGRELLDGYRGSPAADVQSLAAVISLVSRGFVGSELAEFEINPLVWDGDDWVAVDLLSTGP